MKRERIILDLPAGSTWTAWTRALDCARRFATEHVDRPGAHTAYGYDDGMTVSVHWTAARTVSVKVDPSA